MIDRKLQGGRQAPSVLDRVPGWSWRARRSLSRWPDAALRAALQAWGAGDLTPRAAGGRAPDPAFRRNARELASVFESERRAISEAFAGALERIPRWKVSIENERENWDEFLEREFFAFADYLREYFATGDPTYRTLLLGEKIKSLHDPEADDALRQSQTREVDAAERAALEAILQGRCSPGAFELFRAELASIHALLEEKAGKTQRLLLVGDCLFLDVIPFVVSELLEARIKIVADYATSKNPLELRDQLRALSARKFDLVFVSPFSYEFSPAYTQLGDWRQALATDEAVRAAVAEVWDETRATLDLLADLFDAPIHVHNSAALVREPNVAKRLLKTEMTAKVRTRARRRINGLVDAYITAKNAEGLKHLFLIDEEALVREAGELRAGAFYRSSALQHPAVFGSLMAPRYVDVIFANAHLAKKKLVVTDLDNTLWEGVIGEGAVEHHHERQAILKSLKRKGVVLAVNSKNDPKLVHWRGATLAETDFVHAAISWDPKIEGMRRIQSDLNLKMKDFIFIDDRPDELEMMRATYPEIVCLDATLPQTWRRLALWRDWLEDDLEMDRTEMYRQREQRKAFVREEVVSEEERARLLDSLELKLTISRAQPADLKRVVELINRTNQFNLEGSRTTFREVQAWHQSPAHVILLGQTRDRFGDMGTTCVAAARIAGEEMELLPFVLSCRVFGYGIEHGVMRHLKTLAARAGVARIIGRYRPTPQNAPCKDFLSSSGFTQVDGRWIFTLGADAPAVEPGAWLQVTLA